MELRRRLGSRRSPEGSRLVRIARPHHGLVIERQSSGSRARVAKTRLLPAVLDAGNVSGIISAMASGNASCLG